MEIGYRMTNFRCGKVMFCDGAFGGTTHREMANFRLLRATLVGTGFTEEGGNLGVVESPSA